MALKQKKVDPMSPPNAPAVAGQPDHKPISWDEQLFRTAASTAGGAILCGALLVWLLGPVWFLAGGIWGALTGLTISIYNARRGS